MRFCPRCGLALSGLARFLTADGISERQEVHPKGLAVLRRKDYRLSAQLIFFSIIAIPLAIIASIIFDSPGPFAIPFLIFLVGLTKLGYTFLFGKKLLPLETETRDQISSSGPGMLDEPRAYVSAIDIPVRLTTNELIPPPSVTEKTTNLLKENS